MKAKTFPNVWNALEVDPEVAAIMTTRSEVAIAISQRVRSWKATQAQAAKRLGTTQPRLNDLLKGKINKFSLDTLLTLAKRAGLKVKSTFALPPDQVVRLIEAPRIRPLRFAPIFSRKGPFSLKSRSLLGAVSYCMQLVANS